MKLNWVFLRVLIREFWGLFVKDMLLVGDKFYSFLTSSIGVIIFGFLFRLGWEIFGKWGLPWLNLN